MNLVIDIGNSYFKIGVFDNQILIHKHKEKNSQLNNSVNKLFNNYQEIKYCIVSNVSNINIDNLISNKKIKFFNFSSSLKLPFTIKYESFDSLGNDRLALVAASLKLRPNSNNLIIDAGTCITIDFINSKNIYLGGSISPGIEMRYKSLNNYTSRLPLINKSNNFEFPANSTESCIHAGIIGGVSNEISAFIDQIVKKYKNVNIILTGGDAKLLSKTLKITIFANQIFILEGLNSILNLNKL